MENTNKLNNQIKKIKKSLAFYDKKIVNEDYYLHNFKDFKKNFHQLKRNILKIELIIKSEILRNNKDYKKYKKYKKLENEVNYLHKNIETIENYCWDWNTAHQTLSIDILTIWNLITTPILIILTYYGMTFNKIKVNPINVNNIGLFIIIAIPIILIIIFMRSLTLQNKLRSFFFNIPDSTESNILSLVYQ